MFTQADLASRNIQYVHTSEEEIHSDDFTFTVSDGGNEVHPHTHTHTHIEWGPNVCNYIHIFMEYFKVLKNIYFLLLHWNN